MPIYEYECEACRKSFDKFERSMSSEAESKKAPAAKCPSCGSGKTRRKLSAFAAVGSSAKSEASSLPHPGCHCGGQGGGCGMN